METIEQFLYEDPDSTSAPPMLAMQRKFALRGSIRSVGTTFREVQRVRSNKKGKRAIKRKAENKSEQAKGKKGQKKDVAVDRYSLTRFFDPRSSTPKKPATASFTLVPSRSNTRSGSKEVPDNP